MGIDNEKEYPIAAKAIQNDFYMDNVIKLVETPEEPIEVSNQRQPLISEHGFELKKWIRNSELVTEAIPEDLKSIKKNETSRSGTQYGGILSARTKMDCC